MQAKKRASGACHMCQTQRLRRRRGTAHGAERQQAVQKRLARRKRLQQVSCVTRCYNIYYQTLFSRFW